MIRTPGGQRQWIPRSIESGQMSFGQTLSARPCVFPLCFLWIVSASLLIYYTTRLLIILQGLSSKVMGHTENSKGHWIANQYSNVRSLLIKFAQSKGLDPLLPGTWYSISRRSVEESAVITSPPLIISYLFCWFANINRMQELPLGFSVVALWRL